MDLAFFQLAARSSLHGTYHKPFERALRAFLPVTSVRQDAPYKGGMALGTVRSKPDGMTHMVVYVGRQDDTFLYYDPFWHRITRDQKNNMQRPDRWLATLPDIQGADFSFWNRHAENNQFPLRKQAFWLKEQGLKFQPE